MSEKVVTWFTAVWLPSLGVLAGLVVVAAILGACTLIAFRGSRFRHTPLGWLFSFEGVLAPVMITFLAFALFALLASFVVRDASGIFRSVTRLPWVGTEVRQLDYAELPEAEDAPGQKWLAMPVAAADVQEIKLVADKPLLLATTADGRSGLVQFRAGRGEAGDEDREVYRWSRREEAATPFGEPNIAGWYVQAEDADDQDITATLTVVTDVEYPEVVTIGYAAGLVIVLIGLLALLEYAAPKLAAVASATSKSEMNQPLFLVAVSLGAFLLILFMFVPQNTFGEDIKMLQDAGLKLIVLTGVLASVWAAGYNVAGEIEGKTALTVLSKPVSRQGYLIGKYLGIALMVLALVVVMGAVLSVVVAYKPMYDAQETAREQPSWQIAHNEMLRMGPGLLLAYWEVLVLAAISLALSTRLPLIANASIVFVVYLLGHLTPLLVQSSVGEIEFVAFAAQLLSTVIPQLDYYDLQAAIMQGSSIPWEYLAYSSVYSLLLIGMALLLGLLLFEDRDLA